MKLKLNLPMKRREPRRMAAAPWAQEVKRVVLFEHEMERLGRGWWEWGWIRDLVLMGLRN